jgi:DNA mismatch repair protein MutS
MRDGVTAAADLAAELEKFPELAAELAQAMQSLRRPDPAIAAELAAALADELPHLKRDGGFVRAGYDAALDEARALRDESRRVIAALQGRYADMTAVRALKIRHNNVLGYFVEVTAQHGDKLMAPPLNATFIHRQTLAGQVRFTTTELGALEAKIANAADRALGIELESFDKLAAIVTAASRTPPARLPSSMSPPPWRNWRSSATTCGRRSTAHSISSSRVDAIRWWSRFSPATADRSSPMIATCRRPRRRRTAASTC